METLPATIQPISCDLNRDAKVIRAIADGFDYLVLTLTPTVRSEQGYQQAFATNVNGLLNALRQASLQPKRILFVSSTSVYGQNNGEWVDEQSATHPGNYNGRYVLHGEQTLLSSKFKTTVVRFSGIYGPGRDRLLNKVRCGDWITNDQHFTNRIHQDDCAGVLAHLLNQSRERDIENLYLASDSCPAPMNEVCAWLAQQVQVAMPPTRPTSSTAQLNKRCNNGRLLDSGYTFLYPSYREGYQALLFNPD